MVLVTTTASRSHSSILCRAGPEKIPCVKMAYTLEAPASFSLMEKANNAAMMGDRLAHLQTGGGGGGGSSLG